MRQYRLSHGEQDELRKQVKELLKKGWIQPSTSPFGSPVLFVPKPDGSWRMCIDFRALNKLTIRNSWPLPRIDDLVEGLAKAKVFSSLDLAQGYHQIRISKEDVPKTAFKTPWGLYEYKVLPFGLCNAPATFQRKMQEILAAETDEGFCVAYLDDILVYSDSPEQHVEHLSRVLQRLREHRLYARLAKCDFNRRQLKYLGFIVRNGQLQADPRKVQSVVDWPTPTSKEDVRSLLGLTNYFRRFIQGWTNSVPTHRPTQGQSTF